MVPQWALMRVVSGGTSGILAASPTYTLKPSRITSAPSLTGAFPVPSTT